MAVGPLSPKVYRAQGAGAAAVVKIFAFQACATFLLAFGG